MQGKRYYVEHEGHGLYVMVSYRRDGPTTVREVWEAGLGRKQAHEYRRKAQSGEFRERYPLNH